MLGQNTDQFDAFRRERQRTRAKLGPQSSVLGYENHALKELEQVEAREVREQQLTREVHDFFAAATKQAAAIVEKVSHDAEQQVGERIESEMHGFLMDALSRMNSFVMTAMNKRRNQNVAEARLEPDVKHLVGPELDMFRYEGTEEVRDAHIGQDPFETDVEDVQREFRAVVAEMDGSEQAAPIEDHLVAEAVADEPEPQPVEAPAPEPAAQRMTQSEAQRIEDDAPQPSVEEELESFKSALKALVRQGVMQREEARAAWNARLASLGRA